MYSMNWGPWLIMFSSMVSSRPTAMASISRMDMPP
jgi:hypothetical protein